MKIKALKALEIGGSLGFICKNIGLKANQLVKEYMKANPLKKGEKVDIEKFKKFFFEKAVDRISDLTERKKRLDRDIKDVGIYLDRDQYVTRGIPPDHSAELPYVTKNGRGLNPEAMLKKMRELTEPDAPCFNLQTKNCSKTSIAILGAGAEHDPLLKRTVGEEALGFLGTPQQVLGNVQKASEIIAMDKQNTFLTRMANSDMLNQAMGGFIVEYMKADRTVSQKVKAIAGMVTLAILKAPMALVRTILNPAQSISDLISGTETVFKNAKYVSVKAAFGLLSFILMTALAPFALVEKGLQLIIDLFNAFTNGGGKKKPRSESDGQITSPLASENRKNRSKYASYHSMMAELVNKQVAKKIHENSLESTTKKTGAVHILIQFEIDLESNPDKVITLSMSDFDTLNKYVRKKNHSTLRDRFQKCCNESLRRANNLAAHTPSEVDHIVDRLPPDQTKERALK